MLALPTGLSVAFYSGRYDAWFFGALIANFVINGTYAALLSRIYATLAFLPMVPAYPMLTYVDISIILAGTAIGAAGSYISLRKFLKV